MLVIIGYVVVVGSVLGGFMLHGGKLAALFQPFELMIIAGAAIGAFVVSNNVKVLKAVAISDGVLRDDGDYRWVSRADLAGEALPTVMRKVVALVEGDG